MPTMDIFNDDAFSVTSLSAAVDKFDHVPQLLSTMPGLVVPVPVRTTEIWIETRSMGAALIQTSPRGAPPKQRGGDKRDARAFRTVRLAEGSRITAAEIQNIRAWGSESEMKQVQQEVARRQLQISRDFDLTEENLLLSCVQGAVKDADGSTIYDWNTEFGQALPNEKTFDFTDLTSLHKTCNDIRRTVAKNLKGVAPTGNLEIVGLCGDDFWDAMTSGGEVRQTYLNQQAAAELREGVGGEWDEFRYRKIRWINYRSTDDGSTVGVSAKSVKFFPVNAGIFQMAYSPGESFEHVNTLGQRRYSGLVRDVHRNQWTDVEVYSYPLPVCTMPGALHRGKIN